MNWEWIASILSFCSAGVMIAIGIIKFITLGGGNPIQLILGVYFCCFGCILLSSLFKWRWYTRWFGIVSYRFGRGIFCILISFLAYQDSDSILMIVLMCCLIALGLFLVMESCISGQAWQELKGADEETLLYKEKKEERLSKATAGKTKA